MERRTGALLGILETASYRGQPSDLYTTPYVLSNEVSLEAVYYIFTALEDIFMPAVN